MANLPLLLSLANELDSLSLGASPFYYVRHPVYLALANTADKTPQRRSDKQTAGPVSTIGKDGFQVSMDVQQFKPSELNVKVVDNCIVVEAKHEEREDDHGYISRHFVRRYALPKDYDPNKVVSTLSSDGVLTVSVPKPQLENKSNERQIQIQQVGPAYLNIKENPKEDKDKEGEKDKSNS